MKMIRGLPGGTGGIEGDGGTVFLSGKDVI